MVLTPLLATMFSLFATAPGEENLIAPYPQAAFQGSATFKGKLSISENFASVGSRISRGQEAYNLKLKPGQSVMAMVRADNSSLFKITYTNSAMRPITDGYVRQVGSKIYYINLLHREMDIVLVISGTTPMTDEPYELVVCEINTDAALKSH